MARTQSKVLTAEELKARRNELRTQLADATTQQKAAKKQLAEAETMRYKVVAESDKALKAAMKRHGALVADADKALAKAKKTTEKVLTSAEKAAAKAKNGLEKLAAAKKPAEPAAIAA